MLEPTTTRPDDVTPDPRVSVLPFRHPWIKGDDTDPECGRTWHDHGWIDRGDHGFTVCPRPGWSAYPPADQP